MKEDKIIGAMIGLVGACNNNPKTDNTDSLIITALAFEQCSPNDGEHTSEDIIDKIHAEKAVIAPGCSLCRMPCGNTSDYDMSRIYNADDENSKLKINILSSLRRTAKYISQKGMSLSDTKMEFFYKALSYIRYDLKYENLLELLAEATKFESKIKEK